MVPDDGATRGPEDDTADAAGGDGPTTTVRELTTDAEWDAAVPLLGQLWTDADPAFIRSWREEDGYHLFGLYATDSAELAGAGDDTVGQLIGVAGVSIQRVLHHARHAWIHDLVVAERRRSEGFGAELLAFVERWAAERDCEYVALANRLDNEAALAFYEGAGMERWGYVLEREL